MHNVAVIGSGGREHALAWKISQSPSLKKLYCIPGNPGTIGLGENFDLNISDYPGLISFCKEKSIDLVVIGPEQPLVDGLSDTLRNEGINVFGPSSSAAKIESSKSFAKDVMYKTGVPTAGYREFTSDQFEEASDYLKASRFPVVIKADGLAAGKGVLICENFEQAGEALVQIFVEKIFGESGTRIIIEDFLSGEEASVFAVTDGEDFLLLPASQDHKRIGEGDTGKNTGGMGAYAPAPIVDDAIMKKVADDIIKPVLSQLRTDKNKFIGCLYAGLMIDANEIKVVEFNCRFGDPETQAVLPLVDGDFLKLLYSAALGKLDKSSVEFTNAASVCVVAASKGYPDNYSKGMEISGIERVTNALVFHAGTRKEGDRVLTSGGRVLGVTAYSTGGDLKLAKKKAYDAISLISFDGIYFRKDIADKAFKH